MSFLKAEWRKLAFVNYEMDAAILNEYVPFGTELDFWEGKCYISLVGFMFMNVRLLGLKIPFHTNFEEVNQRFYVKRKVGNNWRRGVVFIREMVPKPAITFVANTIYNENYETLPMQHHWQEHNEKLDIEYKWRKNQEWQSLKIIAGKTSIPILANSEAEYITEHYWGYAPVNPRKSHEYEVTHPRWLQYNILGHQLAVDFELNYGKSFAFLNHSEPLSVMLTEGSAITIENKIVIQ